MLFNWILSTAPQEGWSGFCSFHTDHFYTFSSRETVSSRDHAAYLLSLVPLLGLRQILCLGRQMLRLWLLVVVWLLALLAVATYTLLTILRWDLLEEPSEVNTWVEAGEHQIKLCHTCKAVWSEAISTHHYTPDPTVPLFYFASECKLLDPLAQAGVGLSSLYSYSFQEELARQMPCFWTPWSRNTQPHNAEAVILSVCSPWAYCWDKLTEESFWNTDTKVSSWGKKGTTPKTTLKDNIFLLL